MQTVGMVDDHTVDCFRTVAAVTAPIGYAKSGDVNIAYQVTGDGPFDLVLSTASSRTSRSTGSSPRPRG